MVTPEKAVLKMHFLSLWLVAHWSRTFVRMALRCPMLGYFGPLFTGWVADTRHFIERHARIPAYGFWCVAGSLLVGNVALSESPQVRVATFNVALHRDQQGELATELATKDSPAACKIAHVIQLVRPDIILINEIDHDPARLAAVQFRDHYLAQPQGTAQAINFPYMYSNTVNTGLPTGLDLNHDGRSDGPADAMGYGAFHGQYGMAIYSKWPIAVDSVRTFQTFLWKDMPNAKLPVHPKTGTAYYDQDVLNQLRLSSKSHWDVPVIVGGHPLHLLVSHPTPPVFDGPEDRNGARNHDEIRFWSDYVTPGKGDYIYDDQGKSGGLAAGADFVILGDLNADPVDGASTDAPIKMLLEHPAIHGEFVPTSRGAAESATRGNNAIQQGNPAADTGAFGDQGAGNLRVDYVLPSRTLTVRGGGVFWPGKDEAHSRLAEASDHRLVWCDLQRPDGEPAEPSESSAQPSADLPQSVPK